MTYGDIKYQLMQGTTDRFFVFGGDEIEVQNIYIRKIADVNNQTIRRIDSVAEVSKSGNRGLLGKSVCFVCRDDADFQKNESAWDKIESLLKDNTLIYLATKLDKRSKFYSRWDSRIVIFDYMQEPVLLKHIREHIQLSKDNGKELIRMCEGDYGRILTEINKIDSYMTATDTDDANKSFEHLVTDGTLYRAPDDAIFDWVDAVLSGKSRLAFQRYQDCLAIGEPSLRLLLVLYQGVKRLLQVQSCETKNIAETTGLTQWEINTVKEHVGVYRIWELVTALNNIKRLETSIKTGGIDEEFAVPFAMVSILGVWE